jgi:hypothetical protein
MTEIQTRLAEIEARTQRIAGPEQAWQVLHTDVPALVKALRRALHGIECMCKEIPVSHNQHLADILAILRTPR